MDHQLPLFDARPLPEQIAPADPTVPACEKARLDTMRAAVLSTLQRAGAAGATNVELAAVGGYRFSARIHELRKAGYTIPDHEREAGGVTRYRLINL
jgi:imidazolonepropionase-like amidohydrolase